MPRCHGSKIFWILPNVVLQTWQIKPRKLICITFLCMIAFMNKTVAYTFLPSLHNANGFICQERLLRSRDFVTMVTWRHTCPLHWENHEYHVAQNWISDVAKFLSTKNIMFSFKFQGTLCIRETSMKRGAMRESKDLFILDKGLTIYVVMCHSMNNPLPIIGKSTKKEWTNQYLHVDNALHLPGCMAHFSGFFVPNTYQSLFRCRRKSLLTTEYIVDSLFSPLS